MHAGRRLSAGNDFGDIGRIPLRRMLLQPQPGEFAVDCTLGYGGHAIACRPFSQERKQH